MKGQRTRHMTDILFTLALFCVFAVCALMVVMMGADVYRKGNEEMQQNFDSRTSLSYIAAKLRQNDAKDSISVGVLDGTTALRLTHTANGLSTVTWIYCYDGSLREVFTVAGVSPRPEDGDSIMNLADLKVEELPQGLYRVTALEADGLTRELLYSPRSS